MFEEILAPFKSSTPVEVAAKELLQAEHSRLSAQTAVEYATSLVTYNDKRIARLTRFINESKGMTT